MQAAAWRASWLRSSTRPPERHIDRARVGGLSADATAGLHAPRTRSQPLSASRSHDNRRYRALVPAVDDLAALSHDVADSAHVDAIGEVWWHSQDAERAVNAIADAGHVILGPGVEPVTEEDF
jgi:hypothetical protein